MPALRSLGEVRRWIIVGIIFSLNAMDPNKDRPALRSFTCPSEPWRSRSEIRARELWNIARRSFFGENNQKLVERIEPHILQKIRDTPPPTPPRDHSTDISIHRTEASYNLSVDNQWLNDIIAETIDEIINERERELRHSQEESRRREEKARINHRRFKIATATNIFTALIAAVISAAVTITQSCEE